jgi:hypothetical protein
MLAQQYLSFASGTANRKFLDSFDSQNGIHGIWHLEDREQIDQCITILESGMRLQPCVIITEKHYKDRIAANDLYAVDPNTLAKSVDDEALIVTIPFKMSTYFCEKAGGEWAAHSGAVRICWPGSRRSNFQPLYKLDDIQNTKTFTLLLQECVKKFYSQQFATIAPNCVKRSRAKVSSALKPNVIEHYQEHELPNKWGIIQEWVQAHFSDRVVLTPRAIASLKKAQYNDVALAAKAIVLLAGSYWTMRTAGGTHNLMLFEKEICTLGLRLDRSVTEKSAGQWGDAYWVKQANGKNSQLLDWHLAKGSSRDQRHCFRCYFYWDDDSQKVVIGSLPGHLRNSMT